MAGFEKEETTSAIEAVKQIMLRFGSTRALNQVFFLLFLYGLARLDPQHNLMLAWIGVGTTLLTLLSFHLRPHRMNPDGEKHATT